MENPNGSSVSEVKVRTTGQVSCGIGVLDIGTPEAVVALRIGDLVCRVGDLRTLTALNYIWSLAEQHVTRLPYRNEPQHLGATPGLYRVGLLFDLQGLVPSAVTFIAAHGETPAHVRVQFGPIVWQVTDRAAWEVVAATVRRALNALHTLEA